MKRLGLITSFCILHSAFCISSSSAQNFQPAGGGVNWLVRSFFADTVNNILYVGGNFGFVDGNFSVNSCAGIRAEGIAQWDGTKWDSVGYIREEGDPCGVGNPITGIIGYKGKIYTSGSFCNAFDTIDGDPLECIATWDGIQWDSLTTLFKGGVVTFFTDNNDLYVCGSFDTIGGIRVNHIAKWDGSQWYALGNGIDYGPTGGNGVYAIIEYKGEIYAGGNFENVGGNTAMEEIARWDGTSWKPVGGGIKGGLAEVSSFAIYKDTLYVAGYFFKADGNAGDMIMKWDGTQWYDVGGGLNSTVFALAVYNDELYAGGQFSMAGGVSVTSIAKWDGASWKSLGSNIDNGVNALAVFNNALYVGGGFRSIDGDTMFMIAKYVGNVGIENQFPMQNAKCTIFPNPFTSSATLRVTGDKGQGTREFTMYDLLGREVYHSAIRSPNSTISRGNLPGGMYFYKVTDKNKIIATGKIVIQ